MIARLECRPVSLGTAWGGPGVIEPTAYGDPDGDHRAMDERRLIQYPEGADPDQYAEEIPYGLQVSTDCTGLVENAAEREVITLAVDMIVQDCPLSKVASELNSRGWRTRSGNPWTPTDLFSLLPRMIQVGPKLFTSEQWTTRRQKLPRVV